MADAGINAGDLRHRVTIQAPATSQDAFGQIVANEWTNTFTLWASIAAATGRDIYALGSGFTSQVTHKITIRYPGTLLSNGMRVLYEGRVFVIQAVSDPDERKRRLDLMCLEQNP